MGALHSEMSIAELWNKEFLAAGKRPLFSDKTKEVTNDEVSELRKENQRLKKMVRDSVLKHYIIKKMSF